MYVQPTQNIWFKYRQNRAKHTDSPRGETAPGFEKSFFALKSPLARGDELSHFFDRRKHLVALSGIARLTTDDERRFHTHQQLLFALWKEVIPRGPGSVVIPLDNF
jgi:hypothetical protein